MGGTWGFARNSLRPNKIPILKRQEHHLVTTILAYDDDAQGVGFKLNKLKLY